MKAIIPMKWESERLPNKNILPFNGKPLFSHVIETLLSCGIEVWVDTDSERLADMVSGRHDVYILRRPERLYGNHITAPELITHQLEVLDGDEFLYTHVTNPLVSADTFKRAIEAYHTQDCDSVFGVTKAHIRLFNKDAEPINHGRLIQTQKLEPLYIDNSCLYIYSRESFKNSGNRIGVKPYMFEISKIESIDIDELEDFMIAEAVRRYICGR